MSPISRQGWFFKLNFHFSNSRNNGKCKLGRFLLKQSHITSNYGCSRINAWSPLVTRVKCTGTNWNDQNSPLVSQTIWTACESYTNKRVSFNGWDEKSLEKVNTWATIWGNAVVRLLYCTIPLGTCKEWKPC